MMSKQKTQGKDMKKTFTYKLKKSGLKCFKVPMWPTVDKSQKEKEKLYPMVMLESGQVTRVNKNNLVPLN